MNLKIKQKERIAHGLRTITVPESPPLPSHFPCFSLIDLRSVIDSVTRSLSLDRPSPRAGYSLFLYQQAAHWGQRIRNKNYKSSSETFTHSSRTNGNAAADSTRLQATDKNDARLRAAACRRLATQPRY